jgi:hypothetical protein
MRLALAVLCLSLMPQALAQQCGARSGPQTAALVELYTSEGCDSCPPADRWLRTLGERHLAPARVVPLSLHVNYWDYIGWKDPYATQGFTDRQRELARVLRAHVVYTPQVLLQGRDFRGWGGGDFDKAVAQINARAPKARIELSAGAARQIEVRAELLDPAQQGDAALYLARYESQLASSVAAGENRGRTLQHDYVVREWLGPIAFTGGKLAERRELPPVPGAVPAHSGIAAFVQNRRTGEVLQALMLPACPG